MKDLYSCSGKVAKSFREALKDELCYGYKSLYFYSFFKNIFTSCLAEFYERKRTY